MSQFHSPPRTSMSSGDDDDDGLDTLPFAAPLARDDFLRPNFTPSAYLSTLSNRHQTLEDLRAELRARSQLLSKELLDLVNANYSDFLNLGNSLHGGEEKVEEVRVGLLGFRKEVEALQGVVSKREDEVLRLVEERRGVRSQIEIGRRLLEFEARLKELEGELGVNSKAAVAAPEDDIEDSDEEDEDDEDDEDDDEGTYGVSIAKLRRNVVQFCLVRDIGTRHGEHPFLAAQAPRMAKARSTLLLDLSTALQQAKSSGPAASGRVVKVMNMYADMDESNEAVKVLRSLKT